MAAHSKAITQGGALGGTAMVHGGCETAGESRPTSRLDGLDSSLSPQALVEAECEVP